VEVVVWEAVVEGGVEKHNHDNKHKK
jgi:hypothetical protein